MTPARDLLAPRAAGLVAGSLLDRAFGDPRRGHPVAVFGRYAAWLERHLNRRTVCHGAIAHLLAVAPPVILGAAAERRTAPARFVTTTIATWVVLGGRTLAREGDAVAALLDRQDLPAAREQVTHLVGRVTDQLSADDVCRAAVESVAENSSDAVVAPLLWGAVAGVPGLLGYRAVNTLDAMWGHRDARFDAFGTTAARVDDLLNLAPARVTALLVAALPGTPARRLVRVVRRDAPAHPSPNAGVVEAAFAVALGVRLGGRNTYTSGVQDRGTLGDGSPPTAQDLRGAVRLLDKVSIAATAASVVLTAVVSAATSGRRITTTGS